MTPLVDWVARALIAAWQRQEAEGRYRGSDDFRALHIDPADAVASWRAAVAPAAEWPPGIAADFAAASTPWAVADRLRLDTAERLIAALALAVELEPRLRPLVSALVDDPTIRLPTVGLIVELGGACGAQPPSVRAAVDPDGRLARYDLVHAVGVDGRPSLLDAQLVATEWLVRCFAGEAIPPTAQVRWTRRTEPDGTATVCVGTNGPPVLVCGADHVRHAEHLGARAVVMPAPDADGGRLAMAAREARLGDALLLVACDHEPSAALVAGCERLAELGCPVAVSLRPPLRWSPPARWPVVEVAALSAAERTRRWHAGLASARVRAAAEDVDAIARDYALGAGGVDDAIAGLRPGSPASAHQLRAAARRAAWGDLAGVARPGPSGVGWADLVVPAATGRQLHEIADAIAGRRKVLDDWKFGSRPGALGYHLLFAGPSGTGKTLSAAVIAGEAGLELWVVDLARVVDKYLGETEKQLDRVLRAAESSGAMLLFDEADALFGRRGEIKEARDRWANVEVAYLLQRIEDHDGVTVLTTNLSHHLDDAFSRRMSRRVEFQVPDAGLRRRLWQRSVPASTPVRDRRDLDTVADRFELAGGAIRTAALNAALAAAADGGCVALGHVVRSAVGELAKAGREPTRAELGDLLPLVEQP